MASPSLSSSLLLPLLLPLLAMLWQPLACRADTTCRFAPLYSTSDIVTSPSTRSDFVAAVFRGERAFVRSAGVDASTGLTMDGQRLSARQGTPLGSPHMFTASSKESLHVAMLSRALDGDPLAATLFTPQEAMDALKAKADAMDAFFAAYPGFAGFMPWVALDGRGGVAPTPDFASRTPSLDNGQLFWAAFAAAGVLREKYPQAAALQAQWERIWRTMANNSALVFHDGGGRIRTVAIIGDVRAPPQNNTYTTTPDCGDPCYLDDPYEGELFVDMMYLFSPDLSPADREAMWQLKRAKLQRATLHVPAANATFDAQRGWWFSAHETWKYLLLPYSLSPTNWRVFLNGERARSWYAAAAARSPGLWASVTGPVPSDDDNLPYFSDCGVAGLAFQPVTHDDVVTPYGSFPLILASPPHGLAWFHNTILSPRGQNCFGTTEAFNATGYDVSPIVTWDSKITSLLAIAGGIGDINARLLKQMGLLDVFVQVVEREWAAVFTMPLAGEDMGFALPSASVPRLLDDFTSCSADSPPCPAQ